MGSNMQVATKICFAAFWVSFFTLVENNECLKENIDYENIQTNDLRETYKDEQTARVNCAIGFAGYLRLLCENGSWKKIGGRECKKRPCGHPGNTPNGDFRLTRESEFVFGATVEYTCRPGYIMASSVNYRNCRSQGWDNAVPECEETKGCGPPPPVEFADLTTLQKPYYSYGESVEYTCRQLYTMSGPPHMTCEQKIWKGTVRCLKPCTVMITDMDAHNIRPLHGEKRFMYTPHNDYITFACQEGKRQNNNLAFHQPCIDGTLHFPSCS